MQHWWSYQQLIWRVKCPGFNTGNCYILNFVLFITKKCNEKLEWDKKWKSHYEDRVSRDFTWVLCLESNFIISSLNSIQMLTLESLFWEPHNQIGSFFREKQCFFINNCRNLRSHSNLTLVEKQMSYSFLCAEQSASCGSCGSLQVKT